MKVYISGRITGLPSSKVELKFAEAEQKFDNAVNPYRLCKEKGLTGWHECMRVCIAELVTCDCIYLLPDWMDSNGARMELVIAEWFGMKVLGEI